MFYHLLSILVVPTSVATTPEVYPPFLNDRKFLVSQGFNGSVTHNDPLNRYAVDLIMSLGEPVCAVDEGIVEAIQSSGQNTSEVGDGFESALFVRIKHSSGLLSDYQHLLPGSISVRHGQLLAQGECFAKVGVTGNTNGPHLHFSILENQNGVIESIPFKFIFPDGVSYTPKYLGWVYN